MPDRIEAAERTVAGSGPKSHRCKSWAEAGLHRFAVVGLVLGLAFGNSAMAQSDPTQRGPGGAHGAATRSVARYLQQERALADVIARRDRTAVAQTLADDFNARVLASPDAVDRDSWVIHEFAAPARERTVRDLTVREFDDVAVVSFLLDGSVSRGATVTLFVVDVWRQSTGKLLMRIEDRPVRPPGAPSRPTGRE